MKTWLILSVVAGMASTGLAAKAAQPDAGGKPYYYGLHPKLGPVKVDRTTHAMLVGKKVKSADGGAGVGSDRR